MTDSGLVLLDFEDVCRGPIEYDAASLPLEARPFFPGADPAIIDAFADLKSVCVATWCSADARSPAMADAAGYHLQRLRARA